MVWDEVWEKTFNSQEWGKYPNEELIRFIARNFYKVKDRKIIKILEVGCGPGANIWYLAREGFCVYGIDGSITAIKKAKNRLNREVKDWFGDFRVGDIVTLPFDEQFFDAVIDVECLYCNSIKDLDRILDEIKRVLKPKGMFFSLTLATGCWGDETGEKVGYNAYYTTEGPMKEKGFARFTSRKDIKEFYGKNFEIVSLYQTIKYFSDIDKKMKEWVIECQKK